MSIATKTGDSGTTALMYNRRVSKDHPRIAACGAVDELNAALGLARATSPAEFIKTNLLSIQKDLVALMGELATDPADSARYRRDGYQTIGPDATAKLNQLVQTIEDQQASFKGWAMPGENLNSAALDLARTVCRRAERNVCQLQGQGEISNPELIIFLNRLSDVLWLMGRWVEAQAPEELPQKHRDTEKRGN